MSAIEEANTDRWGELPISRSVSFTRAFLAPKDFCWVTIKLHLHYYRGQEKETRLAIHCRD